MTSTKTMARLFLWAASRVLGEDARSLSYLCGAALAHRALGLKHDEGFFCDAVAKARGAISAQHITCTVKEAEQFMETLSIPSDLYDKYAQEAHTLVQDNEAIFADPQGSTAEEMLMLAMQRGAKLALEHKNS